MYTHSYLFNPDICLHIHSADCTVRLLNQAGRNNYPYNPKYVENTGNRTGDIWLDKCIIIPHEPFRHITRETLYQSQLGRLSGSQFEKSEVLFLPGFELGTSGSWG